MPGDPHRGPLPPLSSVERESRQRLQRSVATLAGEIGQRNLDRYDALVQAARFIEAQYQELGYTVHRQTYLARGKEVANLEVEIPGTLRPEEVVVIGAHYDTVASPGADDNASGVAGLLELARLLAGHKVERTLRFVAFVNEEHSYLGDVKMGSWVYAHHAREQEEQIMAMLALEMLGYYSEQPGSQLYPSSALKLVYPAAGNFVAFVSNLANTKLVRRTVRAFRTYAQFPSEGAALPAWLNAVWRSDHASFWRAGYPGLMVTDTANFRNPHYHRASDTPETLDYTRMAQVVGGLVHVVRDLAQVQ